MDFFDRYAELTVGDLKFDTDNFDIFFNTGIGEDDNDAEISIFNLSDKTLFELQTNQFVLLIAGYKEDFGSVFTGVVEGVFTERVGADAKTTLNCTSQQFEIRNTEVLIEVVYPEGLTDAVKRVAIENGISIGYISTETGLVGTGGYSDTNLKDFLDWAAFKMNATWFTVDSTLQVGSALYMVKDNESIPEDFKKTEVPYVIDEKRDGDKRIVVLPLTWKAFPESLIAFKDTELKIKKVKHTSNRNAHTTEIELTLVTGEEPGTISDRPDWDKWF